MAKKHLFVYPNPFIHLDHDGYPAGACPCDMLEHVSETVRKFVGASLDGKNTFLLEKLSIEEAQYRNARQQTRFVFDLSAPTMLPVTEYYKDRLRAGEILPADERTAIIAGVKYVHPREALRAAKEAALKQWRAENPTEDPEGIDSLDGELAKLEPAPAKTEPTSTNAEGAAS